MSIVLQNPLSYRLKLYSPINTTTHFNPTKPLNFSQFYHHPLQFHTYPIHKTSPFLHNHLFSIKAYDSSINYFQEQEQPSNKLLNFDSFLYFLESICVISSFLISLGCFVNWVFVKQQNNGVLLLGNRILVWLLAGAVGLGSVIRRRLWRRVCGPSTGPKPGSENINVIERIEKLEESLKSVTSIIRMLSRQLEKLGIRFRVTRKSLKDPIAETAALAQKNSEATRALVAQEGILEKELAEVQKVLLAMQDQQQKQLELILAIAKSGNFFESKQPPTQVSNPNKSVSNNGSGQVDGHQINSISHREAATNDIASGS